MKKNLLAMLLAFLVLLGCACSSNKSAETASSETPASAATDSAEVVTTAIPADLDLNGYGFRIFTGQFAQTKTMYYNFDEINGETLNDAVYNRNRKIESDLNCIITQLNTDTDVLSGSQFKKIVDSGDDSFDVAVNLDRGAIALSYDNYLVNYYDVPNIDLTQPYWYQSAVKDMTYYNKLYLGVGYDSLTYFDSVLLLLFNKQYFDDYSLGDPYALVHNGTWTMDKMNEMMETVCQDLNGDGEMTDSDLWGAAYNANHWLPNFFVVNEEPVVGRNSDGDPYFRASGNDRFFAIIAKMVDSVADKKLTFNSDVSELDKYKNTTDAFERPVDMFIGGNCLFTSAEPAYTTQLRGMDIDYGILPFPKYEEAAAGTTYYSRMSGYFPLIIPQTNSHLEECGYILESLAYESYMTVIPQYYEICLKQKQTRDTESEEMLKMINTNRIVDIGENFFLDGINGIVISSLVSGNNTMASDIEKNLNKITLVLDEFIESYNT